MAMTNGEWTAVAISAIGAGWMTFGNWVVGLWSKNFDNQQADEKTEQAQAQRILQLESDHKAHVQQDELRFGFLQQSIGRIEQDVSVIRQDVRDIRTGAPR